MSTYEFIALLLVAIGPILAFARFTGAPPSLVLFGVGPASTAVPGVPPLRVDPQLVLNLFLPPLVYASTVRVSWHLLRFTLMPGVVTGKFSSQGPRVILLLIVFLVLVWAVFTLNARA